MRFGYNIKFNGILNMVFLSIRIVELVPFGTST